MRRLPKPSPLDGRAMRLCCEYHNLVQYFTGDVDYVADNANIIIRHVHASFGESLSRGYWGDHVLISDTRYRRGLANAARELRRLLRASMKGHAT